MQRGNASRKRVSGMSSIWERPSRSAATLPASTSRPTTSQPASANDTASGRPTYPNPTIPMFMTTETLAGQQVEVRARHQADELLEVRRRLPAEHRARLARVPDQQVNFGRPLEGVVDHDVLFPV